MRRLFTALIATTAVIVPATTAAAATAATAHPAGVAAAACANHWGTGAKHGGTTDTVATPIRKVRAGEHACFDRLVIDLGRGRRPGFSVRYVRKILSQGSGMVLKVRGKAKLLIVLRAPAGPGFRANAVNLVNVAGFATFRQVRGAGSFERVTAIGLGVRAKLAFRAFTVADAGRHWRLVVDVAR